MCVLPSVVSPSPRPSAAPWHLAGPAREGGEALPSVATAVLSRDCVFTADLREFLRTYSVARGGTSMARGGTPTARPVRYLDSACRCNAQD
jgi:hypothetical protein